MVAGKLVQLVEFANTCMTEKTGKPLTDVQKNILLQALEGTLLKDIEVSGYSQNTIRSDKAPKLWKQLSDVTGRKVTIKTLRLVLEEVLEELRDRQSVSALAGGIDLNLSLRTRGQTPLLNGERSPVLERPGGQIPLNSPFYIQRSQAESLAYQEIAKPGSLIRIKAPKQMGKTSLMARLLNHSKSLGYQTVALNFELADNEVFSSLDTLLRRFFCASIAKALQLPLEPINECWSEGYTNKVCCTNYFEKYVFPAVGKPLVLALDKVDLIFPHHKVADDFFVLLRAWYEQTKEGKIWENFRLLIVHGTEVYIPLSNDQSPFNVGLPVELPEFDANQVENLAQLHGLNLTPSQIERLMSMVGGHPHLIRTAFYKIANQEIDLEQLLKDAPTDMGIYADNLRLLWWHLKKHPELMKTLGLVLSSNSPVELESIVKFKLNSMGLVLLQGGLVTIRNDLYRQYFRDRLNFSQANSWQVTTNNTLKRADSPNPFSSNFLGDNVLATIIFTDVKDSALKQHENQIIALGAIFRDLNLMTQICEQFDGQVLKSMGDGLLMYFVSAVKAVKCAQEIQQALMVEANKLPESEVLEHRIGIHLAEVFFNNYDVYGDGVNIAARIQTKSNPGGICISAAVHQAVKSHLDLQIMSSAYHELKGIKEPILLYQLKG